MVARIDTLFGMQWQKVPHMRFFFLKCLNLTSIEGSMWAIIVQSLNTVERKKTIVTGYTNWVLSTACHGKNGQAPHMEINKRKHPKSDKFNVSKEHYALPLCLHKK